MRHQWVFAGALAWVAVGIVACGDDTTSPVTSSTDAGSDSAASLADASVPAEAGPDGTVDAAAAADAADASDAADATNGTDAADAADGGGPSYALFVGTDFTNAELSVVNLNPDMVAGNLALQDQDSVAIANGGLGFVLERGLGEVLSLSPSQPWTARATIDVNDSADAGAYASNPRAIVVATGTKAYVARYASNIVKIVDVASGAVTGSIDLSAFVAPDDPDGLVDVTDAAYDPATKRAYLLLQRINQNDFGPAPDFVGTCLTSPGEIVAVDATTDTIVSLSDAGSGGAIQLLGASPQALTPDFANGRILIAEGGCDQSPDGGADAGAAVRVGRGVEAVGLSSATSAWLYQTSDVDLLSAILLIDSNDAYVELGGQWYPWNPTQTVLGATPVPNFPQAPFYQGGRVIGLSAAAPDAGDGGVLWSVVALSPATGVVSTLVTSPFKNVVPATSFGVTSAIIR